MPAESVKIARLLRLVYEAEAACTVELYVDLPGSSMVLTHSWTAPATPGIEVLALPIAGTTKGYQIRVKFIPVGVFIAYQDSAIYARRLGRTATDWTWVHLAIVPSGGLTDVKIPIPASGGSGDIKIPIPPSGGALTVPIPVPPSPDQQLWVDLPEDE